MLAPIPAPDHSFAADLDADLTSADRLLCVDRAVALGTYRARPQDAVFSSSKQLRCCYLVFPRTSSEIRLERGPAAVHTPLHLVAYNAGDAYRRFMVSDSGDASDYIAVDHAFLRRFVLDAFGDLPGGGDGLLFKRFATVQTRSLFLRQRRLFDRMQARAAATAGQFPPDPADSREEVLELLLCAVASGLAGPLPAPVPLPAPRQRAIVEEVKRHVSRAFCERLDLEHLAALSGVSSAHLARIFRRQVGMSIHQFVIELRLRASLDLLLEMRSIADAAAQLGFSHHSHFTAAFGKAFGITPSAYLRAAPPRSGRRRLRGFLGPERQRRGAS